jgi:hypothetical protein
VPNRGRENDITANEHEAPSEKDISDIVSTGGCQ